MNIYVANISFKVSEEDLKGIFEEYGAVDTVKIITDRNSGRSKGFGFVEMPNDEEAQNAINELNNYELDGRKLVVNIARPKTENKSRQRFNRY